MHARTRRALWGLLVALILPLLAGSPASAASPPEGAAATSPVPAAPATTRPSLIRVDQVGYAVGESKVAFLLSVSPSTGVPFRVVDDRGGTVFRGAAGPSRGAWNARYTAVHALDFSDLRTPGRYRVVLHTTIRVVSPWFRIASAAALFDPLVSDVAAFFQAQRDGANVIPGPLDRQPSHLNDRRATLYAWPTYESPDSDVIVGSSLTKIGGPVDLAGGWFDAGDFIKFTHTTAYATTLLLASQRAMGAATPDSLVAEIRHGLAWLRKTWNPRTGVMYLQVGIGSGNQAGTFLGDHDIWRLPQEDDTYAGADATYIRNRPAFRANAPGTPLPPNLAGRVSAAFALAAQVDVTSDPARARRELAVAAQIFAAAKTRHVLQSDVVTALPHAFYPESSWRDDMELGAAELALAAQDLGDARATEWLRASARWARGYIAHGSGKDTLNLYDVSALAHADLIRAMRRAGTTAGMAVSIPRLESDLRSQLEIGAARASADPFAAGAIYSDFDAASHAFGLDATAQLYRHATGDASFAGFATRQRDWALGANAWGVSLMIGEGTRFPQCPQHVVANLSGSLDGSPPILRGAVVNGPNDRTLFEGGLGEFFEGAPACPTNGKDAFSAFTGHGSRFVDDVRSWQTVEPALDFTATAALAFALSR